MHVAGSRKTQQLLQVDLFRRRIQQIKAADNMINLLQVVINDHSKLIGNDIVFTLHDEIAILLGEVTGNQTLQFILKCDDAIIGFNSQCMRCLSKDLTISANTWVNIGL
jgi:hypothetical protein